MRRTDDLACEDHKSVEAYLHDNPAVMPHYKGWNYQVNVIQDYLDSIGVKSEGGDPDFFKFMEKGNNVKGYDIVITLPNGKQLKIECKYRSISYTIFPSSFEKEFLNKDCDILVMNNIYVLTYYQRRALELKGIKLMSTSQFKAYTSKLMYTLRIGTSEYLGISDNIASYQHLNSNRYHLTNTSPTPNSYKKITLSGIRVILSRFKTETLKTFHPCSCFLDHATKMLNVRSATIPGLESGPALYQTMKFPHGLEGTSSHPGCSLFVFVDNLMILL